jgi:SAM-dependent methyltransferase
MDESQGFDAEQFRARIHENARKRRPAPNGADPGAAEPAAVTAGEADRGLLQSTYDISGVRFVSHRRVLGRLAVLVKTLLRRLLAPVLSQQAAYNAANIRIIAISDRDRAQLRQELDILSQHEAAVQEGLHQVIGQQAELRDHLASLTQQHASLTQQHAELQESFRALAQQHGELQQHHRETEERLQQRLELSAARQAEAQEHLDGLARNHSKAQDELHALGLTTEGLAGRQGHLEAEMLERYGRALPRMHERIASAERKLRRILHSLNEGQGDSPPSASTPLAPGILDADFDYAGFEERFRGSEDATKARQEIHLEQFKGRDSIVEIGCGRGEFLELLRNAGVGAKGVDIDLDMILYCREKGLDVVREDALVYLESLPDDSLGGVFAAQVIEHLQTADLTRLIRLCHRKLRPSGVLVLETLNPECLSVIYRWFWIDLTHVRLVHPETLKFLLDSSGFLRVECRFLPVTDAPIVIPPLEIGAAANPELSRFNAAMDYLNKLLYGSSDYAVAGIK